MLHEHAITYQEHLTITDLDYLVKKANSLGKKGRDILHVYEEKDSEGTHVYFSVTGLVQKEKQCK